MNKLLSTLRNNKGFSIAEVMIAMVVITLVTAVTVSSITSVRINTVKSRAYEEARIIAQNSYEFFVFAVDVGVEEDEYSFDKLLLRCGEYTEYTYALEDYMSVSGNKQSEFVFEPFQNGDLSYDFTFEDSYYQLYINVNYDIERPSYSAICYGNNNKFLFKISYEKGAYDYVQ